MALKDYFDKDIIIEEPIRTPNGMGGSAESWAGDINLQDANFTWLSTESIWAGQITVRGLIDYMSGKKEEIARQYQENTTHIMMADKSIVINIGNRVRSEGKIYRVLHVDTPFNKHKEVLLQYVDVDNTSNQ